MNKISNKPSISKHPQIGTAQQEFRAVEKKKIAGFYSVSKTIIIDYSSVIISLYRKAKLLLVSLSLAVLYSVPLHFFIFNFHHLPN